MRSFEELFTQYFPRVYRFARRLTGSDEAAEELTQQTFFKALKSLDSFQGRSDEVTWLCSIAKHEFLNRKTRAREAAFQPDSPVFDAQTDGPDAELMRREQVMRLHRILHGMQEPCREVFMLRVFGELSFAQIASLFQKTESWARVTYYRAKLEVRRRAEEENEDGL